MANNDSSSGSFAIGFILGGIIGALAALLLAPKKGSETRTDLVERSVAMRAIAEELAAQASAQAKDRASVGVAQARERINPVVEQVSARINRNPDSADETTESEARQNA